LVKLKKCLQEAVTPSTAAVHFCYVYSFLNEIYNAESLSITPLMASLAKGNEGIDEDFADKANEKNIELFNVGRDS
jgi:hypothetical protein